MTGTLAANRIAAEADVVIGIGTRWSDFTTASKSAFRAEGVTFVNVNVARLDAAKHAAVEVVGDARNAILALRERLADWRISDGYRDEIARVRAEWEAERARLIHPSGSNPLRQQEVLGVLNDFLSPSDVLVGAAGSMPGDLHKLWRVREPRTYHVEYGYSCMGYEIAGGVGVKLAAPEREVFVLVGDGSYLMLSSEIVTAVQEQLKMTIVLVDNGGFSSIGALSRSLGADGFGTHHRVRRGGSLGLDSDGGGEPLPVDLGANAAALGARLFRAQTLDDFRSALRAAAAAAGPVVIHVPVDRYETTEGYETWWDVPVPETSSIPEVRAARGRYQAGRAAQRFYV